MEPSCMERKSCGASSNTGASDEDLGLRGGGGHLVMDRCERTQDMEQ
jgi:hypothetical protein